MPLRDRARGLIRGPDQPATRDPQLSFGSWDVLAATERVIQICHPDWRGVRTVAYSFRTPVVECDNLTLWADHLIDHMTSARIETVVIQGWPPGAAGLATRLAEVGIEVKCVLHSSPAQHGAEMGEAAVADEVLSLGRSGILTEVGMAKVGVPAAFTAAGYPVTYVPNRVPVLPHLDPVDLGAGIAHRRVRRAVLEEECRHPAARCRFARWGGGSCDETT